MEVTGCQWLHDKILEVLALDHGVAHLWRKQKGGLDTFSTQSSLNHSGSNWAGFIIPLWTVFAALDVMGSSM